MLKSFSVRYHKGKAALALRESAPHEVYEPEATPVVLETPPQDSGMALPKNITFKACFESLLHAVRRHNKMEAEKKRREREKLQGPINLINIFGSLGLGALGQLPITTQQAEAVKSIPLNIFGPEGGVSATGMPTEVDGEAARHFHLQYPLTPIRPRKGEAVFSWSDIKWSPSTESLVYMVHEPELDELDRSQVGRIKQIIEEKLDISFDAVQTASAVAYLKKSIDGIITQFGMAVPPNKRVIYEYFILRDFIGLGKLQPFMNDSYIEDISCDGINIPIYLYHRNPLVGSVRTNITFTSKDELDDFVMRLAQKCGKSISVSEPLTEGALPDGSRVQATLGTDIARRGSNFTIRKFTTSPLTPMHLFESSTLEENMLVYFWYAIENGASLLIAGPTASGKTSLLNALSLFIKPSLKIVTIEDTPELKLPHVHWVPEVSRSGFGVAGGKPIGEVTLFDLLKSSLRQRPDYIIVGEVRGEEAYVLFQQMASGHSGLSTIHADSVDKVVDRLTTPPINLPAMLLETLDMIVFVKHMKYRGKYVRRVVEVREIRGYNAKDKSIESACVFRWVPETDTFAPAEDSFLMKKIAANMGMSEAALKKEFDNRLKIIRWMKKNKVLNYIDVGRIISQYYADPAGLMDTVEM